MLQLATGWHAEAAPAPVAAAVAAVEEPALLSTTEILSVLTHELATPLTVVKGHCEQLADLVAHIPRASYIVSTVHRNAERIEHLVTTLTDAQQLESGTLVVHAAPFDLVEAVRDVVSVALPADRPVEIIGDEVVTIEAEGRRIEQILVNLLTNANKFSPPGSPIVVSVTSDGQDATVVVADEGPGIPLDRVGDIFRKFARLERTKKGVGLGLFISRRLARAHRGDLHYRRRHPEGSEFVLTLPLESHASEDG
jgi:two-component system sensor histidine kinase KdpD